MSAPTRELSGGNTQLSAPLDLVVDPINNELFVANNNGTIVVHARTASGNAAPLRVLAGPATQLTGLVAIRISTARGELYALTATSMHVFLLTAMGNTPPIRSITGLSNNTSLAVDAQNEEFFIGGTSNGGVVRVFPTTASGNASPTRTIFPFFQGSCSPAEIDVDPGAGELFVLCAQVGGDAGQPGSNAGGNHVLVLARTASGQTSPIRRQDGSIVAFALDLTLGEICLLDNQRGFISTLATSFQGPIRRITVLKDEIGVSSIGNVALFP